MRKPAYTNYANQPARHDQCHSCLYIVCVDSSGSGKSAMKYSYLPCANPEIFVRGGPTFTIFFLVDEGIQIPLRVGHHRPQEKRHLNGVSLACG